MITFEQFCKKHINEQYNMPEHYTFIDLGLPSGTLWATEPSYGAMSFDQATEDFGDSLPTKEQWEELFDNCEIKYDRNSLGKTLVGPNGNQLFIPSTERSSFGDKTSTGFYWSSTEDGDYAYCACFDRRREREVVGHRSYINAFPKDYERHVLPVKK